MATTNAWDRSHRLAGLRRFAVAITILNIVGRTVLGFEPSWAQLVVAIATTYSLEILLETIHAWRDGRTPAYRGGFLNLVDFLLSAHIAAFAVSMLLYPNERLLPMAFAAAVAIGSKTIFRVTIGKSSRHILNPSNFGITMTLLCFPWVSITPPYQFTETARGWTDWILPVIIILSGTMLNALFTKRLPLIGAWLSGFALQAVLRNLVFGTPILAGLNPMSGVAFILFTFYMVTDPATTPSKPLNQVFFGLAIAAMYAVLMMMHIVFGLFFALTTVCLARGLGIFLNEQYNRLVERRVALQESLVVAGRHEQ